MRVVAEGIASGELRAVEGAGTLSAVIGMNVFYFISAPIMRSVRGRDPFSPRARRAHIASSLDFIGAALFTDRGRGIALAERIAGEAWALPRGLRSKAGTRGKANPEGNCEGGNKINCPTLANDGPVWATRRARMAVRGVGLRSKREGKRAGHES